MATNTQTDDRMQDAKEKANEVKDQVKESARDAAKNVGGDTVEAFKQPAKSDDPAKGFVAIWEQVPTNSYFLAAAGSILLSLVLMLSGKQRGALFVGQWPATIIALAVMNKMLRPSREV